MFGSNGILGLFRAPAPSLSAQDSRTSAPAIEILPETLPHREHFPAMPGRISVVALMLEAYKVPTSQPPLVLASYADEAVTRLSNFLHRGLEAVTYYEKVLDLNASGELSRETPNIDAALARENYRGGLSQNKSELWRLKQAITDSKNVARFISCMQHNLTPEDARILAAGLEATSFILPAYAQDLYSATTAHFQAHKEAESQIPFLVRFWNGSESLTYTLALAALTCAHFRAYAMKATAPLSLVAERIRAQVG